LNQIKAKTLKIPGSFLSGKIMRIGFSSIYSWRPHVGQLYFLANLAKKDGHEVFFLTCDADLPSCYTRELRDKRPDWQECLFCRIGGIRSYSSKDIVSLGSLNQSKRESTELINEFMLSSASTLGRFETDSDFKSKEFLNLAKKLYPSVKLSYNAAVEWIKREKLDAVCVFNGRMDATRAIFEAAKSAGIRVISVERTWLGNGLQMYPEENCLGLKTVNRMMLEWRDKPLTAIQAEKAASYIALRFLKRNNNEWRAYNQSAEMKPWPVSHAYRKILLIPGSRNEIWGHPDWISDWKEPTDAYDALIEQLKLSSCDLVLRCHPNWGEKIGKNDGTMPEKYYTDWAMKRGIIVIPSIDKTSTLHLIEQSDAIVVFSGSAALEAGILGKQVISVGPSIYQNAGFRTDCTSPDKMKTLSLNVDQDDLIRKKRETEISRMTLRFCYTMSHRIAQYVNDVKCVSPTHYVYNENTNPKRFIELIIAGILMADDELYSDNCNAEDLILENIKKGNWINLIRKDIAECNQKYSPIRRRLSYRIIDSLRQLQPTGDR
jgi:hypothetical protein